MTSAGWQQLLLVVGACFEIAGIVLAVTQIADGVRATRKIREAKRDLEVAVAGGRAIELNAAGYLSTDGDLGILRQRLEALDRDVDETRRVAATAAQAGQAAALQVYASLTPRLDALTGAIEETTGSGRRAYAGLIMIAVGVLLQMSSSYLGIDA